MKFAVGFTVAKLAALLALALAGGSCSLINKPCPDPMSCSCPTNKNPACPPFPTDAKKPRKGSK